jgi:tetratricopeptide (TPR) repeat protein
VVAGIAWYLIGLAPTAGLVVQSGSQCFADRFSYISAIGLVIAATWTTAAAIGNLANHRAITAGIVIALVGVLSYRSSAQVLVWKDSISLFSRALEVAPESAIVQHNLGYALASAGRVDEAIVRYRAALSIDPTLYRAHYNLGRALFDRGDLGRALKEFDAALSFPLEPNYKADVLNASGIAFASVGNFAAAEQRFRSALQLEPRSSVIHANLASFLARAGRLDEAIGWYKVAVAESPSYTEARLNLAHALSDAGSRDEAIEEYRTVLRQSPGRPEALAALQRFSMSR